jgi:hypothetical protein
MLKTERIRYVVYEDEYQIVGEPLLESIAGQILISSIKAVDRGSAQSLAPETCLELPASVNLIEIWFGMLWPTPHWCFVPE